MLEANREEVKTASGCIAAIARHTPDVFVGENVVGLGALRHGSQTSDLAYVAGQLASVGYVLADLRVRAERFGSPSPRDRCVRAIKWGR